MEIIFLLFLHLKYFINLTKRIYCVGTVAKCVSEATADTATPAAIQCHGMHARLLALLILPDPPRQRWQSNQTRSCQENGCGKVYLVCVCVYYSNQYHDRSSSLKIIRSTDFKYSSETSCHLFWGSRFATGSVRVRSRIEGGLLFFYLSLVPLFFSFCPCLPPPNMLYYA